MGPLAQVGLALATSVGAWINLILVLWLARRARLATLEPVLGRSLLKLAGAGAVLALVLWLAQGPIAQALSTATAMRDEAALVLLALAGGAVYFALVFALFGRQWLKAWRRRA
jgi:putative peptidoglycan lipid II flippase